MYDGIPYYSYRQRDRVRNELVSNFMNNKLVAVYAERTGRRKRSAAKKLLGIGATHKRTASMKVVR